MVTALAMLLAAPAQAPMVRRLPVTALIVRGEVVRSTTWAGHPTARERLVRDEQGRRLLLRTIELE